MFFTIAFAQATQNFDAVQVKLIKMDDKYYILLQDSQGKLYPNKGISAKVKSDAPELLNPKLAVASFSDNGLVINKDPGKFKTLKVILHHSDGGNVHAVLANASHEEGGFLCPMHPGTISESAGKCAICGVAMVPKRIIVYDPVTVTKGLPKKEFELK
jgi:hypothetical protein